LNDTGQPRGSATGVLLTNLGTPDTPTPAAVRRYLAEFLSDRRVVDMPRWLWWPLLHGVILRVRPRKVARAYRSVWTEQGSPLLAISRRQASLLGETLARRLPGRVEVAAAMRYGRPSIEDGLNALRDRDVQRLLVLPLYPQYSATTTASTFDAVFDVLRRWRRVPELRLIRHYHAHPAYIEALAASVREHWQAHGRAERLLMSFHGLPRRYQEAGDPYFCECRETARQLAGTLGLEDTQWQMSFQSRFGREEWLRPYTDHTLRDWAAQGVHSVQVLCPGFSADCLETLEEIAMQNRDLFLAAGGQSFEYIAALNDRPDHIDMLAALVRQHMEGWRADDEAAERRLVDCLQAPSRART